MRKTKRILAIILALAAMMSLSVCAFADGSTINTSKTGTLDIYKYDAASAEKDGVWTEGDFVSIGVRDEDGVETTLGGELNADGTAYGYAIKGVEFTYLIHIKEGKDMITLLTCHPPNTGGLYRYLVFCERAQ